MSENINFEAPLDNEVYCFTARAGDKYHTLITSYIVPTMISNDHILRMDIADHKFIGQAGPGNSMFLIPYDSDTALEHAEKVEHFNLTYSNAEEAEFGPKGIDIPMVFNLSVEPHFTYMIKENQLYKKEEDRWQIVQS